MGKATRILKGDSLVVEKGAMLVIGGQSFTVAEVTVLDKDGKPVTIKTLVPGKEV